MTESNSFLRRNLRQVSLLVAGRTRYLRSARTAMGVLRAYGSYFLSVERLQGGRGSLAARAMLSRAHGEAARRFVCLAEQNGGGWIKAAQFFSCRPDVLPREYIVELQKLQNDAPAVDFAELEPTLIAHWGSDWENKFSSFDRRPVATASIAQVHRARLVGGEEVAVKIRLPDVVEHFRQDEAAFRMIAGTLAPLVSELDLTQVVERLLSMTLGELDFRNEASNLKRFASLPHRPRIRVSKLHEALSGSDVLVTGWVYGERLREHLDENPERAQDLLTELFLSYIQQVTQFGIYQADPHPGNFIVGADGSIAILDFGVLAFISAAERDNYTRLLFACVNRQTDGIGDLFERAGFIGGTAQTLQALADYALTDQIARDGVADSMINLLELLREQKVKIPDSWIAIARVLITVGGFLMAYKVPLPWNGAVVLPGTVSEK